ncbi:Anaphase-promoting complex subunit 2 [Dermatophagoides farinae]|uniref:Anaphase-promoting complex subunit 2 n=1 Tax=Dermatophagoides farinae TaxID=6954 RepID=A0A922LDN0_DERFA|nr:Anaphase-promoting complex subunit 2 [Dermatophagoides farinae]
MDSEFEFLINSLNISSKYPPNNLHIDLKSDLWLRCQQIIANLKKDSEAFEILQEYYIYNYRCYLTYMLKEYWSDFLQNSSKYKEIVPSQHRLIFHKFNQLNDFISNWLYQPLLDLLFDSNGEQTRKLNEILYTGLIADMPLLFSSFLFNTFAFSFAVLDYSVANKKKETIGHEQSKCKICRFKRSDNNDNEKACYCESMSKGFIPFLNVLRKLGIFHQLCDDIIKSVLFKMIERQIWNLCKDKNFELSCLSITCSWLENSIIDWMKIIYIIKSTDENVPDMFVALEQYNTAIAAVEDEPMNKYNNTGSGNELNTLFLKNSSLTLFDQIESLNLNIIRSFLTNTYIFNRMKQLFDIIIDYPYSEPAIYDLHECIQLEPFYREIFTHSLKNALEIRLLHAGVATSSIIEAYLTTIKALRLLDPQGIILQIVCDPIRNYLKTREDTVRCIINILTTDSIVNFDDPDHFNKLINDEDEYVMDTWRSWVPQTIGVSKMSKDLANSDIISMLINIFDSKDLFVQEYQRLLAQKLILTPEINLESELRNLELLSLRFGESELHNCEVMLKDLKDSERINQQINGFDEMKTANLKMNGLILSEQFWPDNLGFTSNEFKNFRLPDEVQQVFDNYKKFFETLKGNRTVNWIQQLGMVKLELEFPNGSQEYSVRPIQAAIIHLFQRKNQWSTTAIAQELDVLPSVIRRNLSYWKNIGIVKECDGEDDSHMIVEDLPPPSSSMMKQQQQQCSGLNSQEFDMMFIDHDDDDNDHGTMNNQQKNENNLHLFWNFIDNMLKNLHALSLDRIYSMLKMFNMQSPEIENLSMHELREFLDRKVYEKKLIFINGLYDLNKSDGE